MKQTLRDEIESMLIDVCARQNQLRQHEKEYSETAKYADAMSCGIRWDTLETVRIRLVKALE